MTAARNQALATQARRVYLEALVRGVTPLVAAVGQGAGNLLVQAAPHAVMMARGPVTASPEYAVDALLIPDPPGRGQRAPLREQSPPIWVETPARPMRSRDRTRTVR